MGLLLQVISGNRYGGFGLTHVVGFLYINMDQKLSDLLDYIQDDNGTITLPRAHLELLISKYGPLMIDVEIKEKRTFLIGLFQGSIFTIFGSIVIFKFIEFFVDKTL